MNDDHSKLKDRIRDIVSNAPANTVWTPVDFTNLASRDAVDKCLQRQVASGDIRRIDRGLYDKPTVNGLTRKLSPPDARGVIDAIARRDQVRVMVDGMTAANDIGLTNAVPANITVHVDARLRPITLGSQTIHFRPTAASKLYWAGHPAMRLVQAMHWLKDVVDTDDGQIMGKVDAILNDPVRGDSIRTDLVQGMSTLPAWLQALLKPRTGTTGTVPDRQLTMIRAPK